MYVLLDQSQGSIFIKRHFESKFVVDIKWIDEISYYYIDIIYELRIYLLSFININLILCLGEI